MVSKTEIFLLFETGWRVETSDKGVISLIDSESYTKKLKLKAIVRYNSRVVIKWGIWYNLSDRVLFLKNIENI